MAQSMIERMNSKDKLFAGVRIGGRVTAEGVLDEIRTFCDSPYVNVCYVLLPKDTTFEYMIEWAKELKKTKTYFYLHPFFCPFITREMVEKVKEAAGEYYLGAVACELNERGTRTASVTYATHLDEYLEQEVVDDLETAVDNYVNMSLDLHKDALETFPGESIMVEATMLLKYMYRTKIDFIISELENENLDCQVAYTRGATRGYGKEKWGNLLAHEYYGGVRDDNPAKFKRLKLLYDYVYMSGSKCMFIENGEFSIKSYGYYFPMEHELCKLNKKIREDFIKSILNDERPAPMPMCRVGFIHGNLDPYVGFASSGLMYHRKPGNWAMQDAERSWKMIDGLKQSIPWHDPNQFGDEDAQLSNAPGYGDFDIVPIESSLEALCSYDYLIFLGWNSMTEEYYEKLKAYVAQGGNLVISAAHLNTNTKRDGAYQPIGGGQLADFLGCNITGSILRDSSVKFVEDSMIDGILYPMGKGDAGVAEVDPMFPAGNIDLAKVELKGGKVVALSNNARHVLPTDEPILIENRYGKGVVSFIPTLKYPAASEVREFYTFIIRSVMTASHKTCDVKVIANDRVKFNVYDAGEGKRKVYLLNTDFNLPNTVIVKTANAQKQVTLEPMERKEFVI